MGLGYVRVSVVALAAAGVLALSACDRGPAAIPARDHSAEAGGSSLAPAASAAAETGGAADQADPRKAPVPLVDGKPMWAANRRHTAEENARYQFGRDGADFGARDLDDFVAKAHAFVDHPPRDVQTLTRSNGDRLLYDAHANVFAVVSREGAPRTMFKPRDGAAYWDEQKQRIADQASQGDSGGYGYHSRRRRGDSSDDQG